MATLTPTEVQRLEINLHDNVIRLERAGDTDNALTFSLRLLKAAGNIFDLLRLEEEMAPHVESLKEVHTYAGELWRPIYTDDPKGTFVEIMRVDHNGKRIDHPAFRPRYYRRRSRAEHEAGKFLGKVCGQVS